MKSYRAVIDDVEELQFKFHDNWTSLSMAKIFFPCLVVSKKTISGTQNFLKCHFFPGNGELNAFTYKFKVDKRYG